ncbi:hypothetical protein Pla22_45580 [Rubripirellula amarantea]|uniref:Uncharacterized protein n=1 Tax=Rubripirellula amarantea TaxID=2527999 RepID=A0A5C5WHT5_9BACT|nr:hypothetical protein [Rubripirellula amarantea]TWT49362.1 hypothetical protein Pla22_45580 [Rubripirellula amarantea]
MNYPIERIRYLALIHLRAAEQSEASSKYITPLTKLLGEFMPKRTFYSGYYSRAYDEQAHIFDSGDVGKAALSIPKGLGIAVCNSEEWSDYEEQDILYKVFKPYTECRPRERAFINSEIPALMKQLLQYAEAASVVIDM